MTQLTDRLQQLYNHKKILILGWGREGQSTYQLLKTTCPDAELFVSDATRPTDENISVVPYLDELSRFDIIFKTPGIPVSLPELQTYLHHGGHITSQLNEFLHVYRHQVIGVTGTKGKSTTTSLIAHIFEAAGKNVLFAGNIGTPVFDIDSEITPDTILTIEMSSYQLETVTASPHIAVLLNFFPEHLNYHNTLEHYFTAKTAITRFQTAADYFLYNQDIPRAEIFPTATLAQIKTFSDKENLSYPTEIQNILSNLSDIQLPETIKRWNILPALLAVHAYDPKLLQNDNILASLASFQPLPHRLQTVSNAGGITWIDDTLATIPEATIAALETLPRVDTLLLGGYDRGIEFTKIVEAVMTHKIPAIAFFKPSGQKMYDALMADFPSAQKPMMKVVDTMEEAVRFASTHTPKGGVVLLSPSSPSFGQFRDYRDKAAQFQHWITQLVTD
jgi:UDP-N-acetylmuramoyl-L-alanine---L-glutamate ligase